MKKLLKKKFFKFKKQSIKIGDSVLVICGNDKTKQGKVIGVLKEEQKIIIEGINSRFRYLKPQRQGEIGKIKQFYAPIDISNVKKLEN
jgi:large subunit ribosomal protein L24